MLLDVPVLLGARLLVLFCVAIAIEWGAHFLLLDRGNCNRPAIDAAGNMARHRNGGYKDLEAQGGIVEHQCVGSNGGADFSRGSTLISLFRIVVMGRDWFELRNRRGEIRQQLSYLKVAVYDRDPPDTPANCFQLRTSIPFALVLTE